MPASASTRARRPTSRPSRRGKVRKEFWLDQAALRRAQSVLGVSTERETVEIALDLVALRRDLVNGVRALARIGLDPAE